MNSWKKPTIIKTRKGGRALVDKKTYFSLKKHHLQKQPTVFPYFCARKKECNNCAKYGRYASGLVELDAEGKFTGYQRKATFCGCDNIPFYVNINGPYYCEIANAREEIEIAVLSGSGVASAVRSNCKNVLGIEIGGIATKKRRLENAVRQRVYRKKKKKNLKIMP